MESRSTISGSAEDCVTGEIRALDMRNRPRKLSRLQRSDKNLPKDFSGTLKSELLFVSPVRLHSEVRSTSFDRRI